jgi:pimeloyl-ACP methyl ester carboxylesterase
MRPSPPHLLLLPGLSCNHEVWKHQARTFSDLASVRIADYGSCDSIADMAGVALRLAPERFALAGHSMGGRVALEIVRRAPSRVAGLALLDTGYQPWKPGAVGERERADRMALVELAQTKGMHAMARRWVQNMVHPARLSDAALINSIVEMFGRRTPEIFAAQIKALLNRPDFTSALSQIECPTLVLCGREDAWSPVVRHRDIAARIRGSMLAIIENCGHMAPVERPLAVAAAMQKWFERLS